MPTVEHQPQKTWPIFFLPNVFFSFHLILKMVLIPSVSFIFIFLVLKVTFNSQILIKFLCSPSSTTPKLSIIIKSVVLKERVDN